MVSRDVLAPTCPQNKECRPKRSDNVVGSDIKVAGRYFQESEEFHECGCFSWLLWSRTANGSGIRYGGLWKRVLDRNKHWEHLTCLDFLDKDTTQQLTPQVSAHTGGPANRP